MIRISASQVRQDFSDTLNRVAFGGERVIVRRNNKDVAALVSMDEYEFLSKLTEVLEERLDVKEALARLDIEGSIPLDEL